jgi:hypothetical protein
VPKPAYSGDHERARRAAVVLFRIGDRCPRCGEPMWGPVAMLDMDHETDELGRKTGRYLGLSHRRCNRRANPWNMLGRGVTGATARERDARQARKELREGRAAFDAVQKAIALELPGREW